MTDGTTPQRFQLLKRTRAGDHGWAAIKYDGYYQRHLDDAEAREYYVGVCADLLHSFQDGGTGALPGALIAPASEILQRLLAGTISEAQLNDETEMGFEFPLFLHRVAGGYRERYLSLVKRLPPQNDYAPTYITMGPTGKCNVVCPDCIIGGAIFQKERQQLHTLDDVAPYLAQIAASGVDKLSFCIGEPTYNIPMLYKVFDFVAENPPMSVRSLVTNALFARKYEKAVAFLEGVRDHLGAALADQCLLGVSLNDPLRDVGVPVSATANLIQAFGEVFPQGRLVLQLIMDQGFHQIQNALFQELAQRGLLGDPDRWLLAEEGFHNKLPLSNGTEVIVSVMRKQPSLHNLHAAMDLEADPWVRYFTREALTELPRKGLYTYDDNDDPDQTAGGIVVHRVTLAPDGVFFPDYHFMVAGTRPLGTTLVEAIDSFRRDPLLGVLLHRGGLNVLLSTYMSIPDDQRLVRDIYQLATTCTTTGMAAANVIFGDYEVALQLLERLLNHGMTVPGEAPPIEPA